ncbi:MAG: VapD family protein [Oscillospiraceae bacterium]
MNNFSRKSIDFDLKQELLKQYYPRPKHSLNPFYYKKAYADIKNFFTQNGFKHRQGSVYVSNDKLTIYDIQNIIDKAAEKLPWLDKCVAEIDVTDIGKTHSIKELLMQASFDISQKQHSAPDKTDTMEYYEAEIAKRQKQQLPHGEDLAIEKLKRDKER